MGRAMTPAQETELQALRCSAFWSKYPDSSRCERHEPTVSVVQVSEKAQPHVCPVCCDELIDSPEGRVQGFYGRLVFPTDPPNPTCANCGTALVPSRQDVSTSVAA